MGKTIKELFEEIPEFDQPDAAKIMRENCDKIFDELSTIISTTLNSEEEQTAQTAHNRFFDTFHKEVRLSNEQYEKWQKDKTTDNWDEYEFIFKEAYKHIKGDLTHFIE